MVDVSVSSPDEKMFFRCSLMVGTVTLNNSAIFCCVSQNVSRQYVTSTGTLRPSSW